MSADSLPPADWKPVPCPHNPAKLALYRCRWKLTQPFMIWAKDLAPGDKLQIGLAYFLVEKVVFDELLGLLQVHSSAGCHAVQPGVPVMVLRPGHCGAACCDDCGREVAPSHRYCPAHWDAWERHGELDQRVKVEE